MDRYYGKSIFFMQSYKVNKVNKVTESTEMDARKTVGFSFSETFSGTKFTLSEPSLFREVRAMPRVYTAADQEVKSLPP